VPEARCIENKCPLEKELARSDRLMALTQILRRHRLPVTAAALAEETGVSARTLYRDIATLAASGVPVRGEAGVGYVLEAGFDLPPLMLSAEECEALMLGARFVRERGDAGLQRVIDDAIAKIEAVLPETVRLGLRESSLYAPMFGTMPDEIISSEELRRAIRDNCKIRLHYRDLSERETHRTVWPVMLGYFERTRGLVAWCEMRGDFRHFRTDRMLALEVLSERPPRRRAVLVKEWERQMAQEKEKGCLNSTSESLP
jgi:predicted DNA-binding transcriptional regulator YafY